MSKRQTLRLYMPDPEAETGIVKRTLSLLEESGVKITALRERRGKSTEACTLAVLSRKALERKECRDRLSALAGERDALILLYTEDVALPPGLDLQLSPIQSLYAGREEAETLASKILDSPCLKKEAGSSGRALKAAALLTLAVLASLCFLVKAGYIPFSGRKEGAKAVFFLPDSWSDRQKEQVSEQILANAAVLGVDEKNAERTDESLRLSLPEEAQTWEGIGEVVQYYLAPPLDLNIRNDTREGFFALTPEDIKEAETVSVTLSEGGADLPPSLRAYEDEGSPAEMTEGKVLYGVRITLSDDFLQMFPEYLAWTPEDVVVLVRNFTSDERYYDYASVTEDHRIAIWSLRNHFSEPVSRLLLQNLLQEPLPSQMHSAVVRPHLAGERTSKDLPADFTEKSWVEIRLQMYDEGDPDRIFTDGEKLDRDSALCGRLDAAGIPYILGAAPEDPGRDTALLRIPEPYFGTALMELLCAKDLPDTPVQDPPSFIAGMVRAWYDGTALPCSLYYSISFWVDETGRVREFSQITDHYPVPEEAE